jgi:hypothetical protein
MFLAGRLGVEKMRIPGDAARAPRLWRWLRAISVLLVPFVAAGCAATKQEVSEGLGNQFVGKNVDVIVSQFGPPASSFRMNSGDTAYVWQLAAVTNIDVSSDRYGSSGVAKTNYCKVNVIASPVGIVTKLTTEDSSGTGGILGLAGVDIYGSVCARHLGMPRRS